MTGRQRSVAIDVAGERLDASVPIDVLDAEAISRTGDSDVALALRRLPGLTVVQDKFIYVRGLGERYSSTQLNGAFVPSPDLTRNVLPLDLFPSSIVDALFVHKGYTPELPAAFGGGNVDISTKGGPLDQDLSFTISSGWNSEMSDGLTYSGGSDDRWGTDDGTRKLPDLIRAGIQEYRGSFSPGDILQVLREAGGNPSIVDAQNVNRELATSLNRNIDLRDKDIKPDVGGQISAGYRWFIGNDLEFSFLALASYDYGWRNKERSLRRVTNPDKDFSHTVRTIESVSLTGNLGLGVEYTEDHKVKLTGLLLRNSEDEAAVGFSCAQGQFNDCGDGAQGRIMDVRFEERELEVGQIAGQHALGAATMELLPQRLANRLSMLENSQFSWYYSDSEATTDLPNEVRVSAIDQIDPITGAVIATNIRRTGTALDYRFSALADEVLSHGWDFTVPIVGGRWDLELSGGYDYSRKARDYRQTSLGLGSNAAGFALVSSGSVSETFSDDNILNPVNGIEVLLGVGGFGLESYFAAQLNDSYYGRFDLLIDETWRIAGGLRYEEFTQVSVPIDLLEFSGPRTPLSAQELADSVTQTDDFYPALAVTYIRPGFYADEFQFRVAWSETVGRPDLREVSQSTYIDPLTEARVRGNGTLQPADIQNVDVRAEWFWDAGDSFTISGFLKNISDPIETVQGGATEDNILFNFVNAESAEIYGVEVEGIKSLGFLSRHLGGWIDQFYLAGNVAVSDSEIKIEPGSGGVGNITNTSRRLTQHSKWVSNVQLGFDSANARHSASLVYNSFGERIFFAGIDGQGDAFEQPFHSLDLVYSWFPTERVALKLRAKNVLNESVEIEQDGVNLIEQSLGTTVLMDVSWSL